MKDFRPRSVSALLGLSLLAGCAAPRPEAVLHCPQVDVLQQAQTVTAFLPGRADVAAQVTTARIAVVAGSFCQLDGRRKLRVSVTAGFEASNGPANNGADLRLPWFAAITQGDQIIQETDYTMPLSFNGNASQTSAQARPVKIELPNLPGTERMEILIGFKMTPDQLAYAAAHPGATP